MRWIMTHKNYKTQFVWIPDVIKKFGGNMLNGDPTKTFYNFKKIQVTVIESGITDWQH